MGWPIWFSLSLSAVRRESNGMPIPIGSSSSGRSRNILLRSGESQAVDIGEHNEIDKVVVANLVRDEMAPDIAMKNASA